MSAKKKKEAAAAAAALMVGLKAQRRGRRNLTTFLSFQTRLSPFVQFGKCKKKKKLKKKAKALKCNFCERERERESITTITRLVTG